MQRLRLWVRAFFKSRIFRVGIIGLIGLTIQTSIFEVLGIVLNVVSPSTAVLIGAEVSILCIFFLNARFSFNDRRESGGFLTKLAKFHVVIAGSVFLQWLLTFAAENLTDNVMIIRLAYLSGVGLGFVTNYLGYLFFVWRHPKASPPQNTSEGGISPQ
jgi:putative flippase GtrA